MGTALVACQMRRLGLFVIGTGARNATATAPAVLDGERSCWAGAIPQRARRGSPPPGRVGPLPNSGGSRALTARDLPSYSGALPTRPGGGDPPWALRGMARSSPRGV